MKKILLLVLTINFLAGCNSPKEKMSKKISEMENNDSAYSPALLQELKNAYMEYATKYPDDEKSPIYMFKAAQRSIALSQPEEAVTLLNDLIVKYPKNAIHEEALFLLAFTYENSLNNLANAGEKYREFIEKYPENELAEDAKLALQNLGKSPEEIIGSAQE